MWTESNPGRDALRQRGRGRVNGKQLTEGLIMKTRQEMKVDRKESDREAEKARQRPERN